MDIERAREMLAAASPEPWGPVTGPSSGKQRAIDDGGDFGILHPQLRPGMIMMEAIRLVQPGTDFPAEANAALAVSAPATLAAYILAVEALEGVDVHAPEERLLDCRVCKALAAWGAL